jgi:hypothetical protein
MLKQWSTQAAIHQPNRDPLNTSFILGLRATLPNLATPTPPVLQPKPTQSNTITTELISNTLTNTAEATYASRTAATMPNDPQSPPDRENKKRKAHSSPTKAARPTTNESTNPPPPRQLHFQRVLQHIDTGSQQTSVTSITSPSDTTLAINHPRPLQGRGSRGGRGGRGPRDRDRQDYRQNNHHPNYPPNYPPNHPQPPNNTTQITSYDATSGPTLLAVFQQLQQQQNANQLALQQQQQQFSQQALTNFANAIATLQTNQDRHYETVIQEIRDLRAERQTATPPSDRTAHQNLQENND